LLSFAGHYNYSYYRLLGYYSTAPGQSPRTTYMYATFAECVYTDARTSDTMHV